MSLYISANTVNTSTDSAIDKEDSLSEDDSDNDYIPSKKNPQ